MSFPEDDFINGIITGGGPGTQHIEIGIPGAGNASRIFFYDGTNPTPSSVGLNPAYGTPALELTGTQQRGVWMKSSDTLTPAASVFIIDNLASSNVHLAADSGQAASVDVNSPGFGGGKVTLRAVNGGSNTNLELDANGILVTNWGTDTEDKYLVRGDPALGLIVKYGSAIVTTDAAGFFTLAFPVAFPNGCVQVVMQLQSPITQLVDLTAYTATNFTGLVFNSATGAAYLASNINIGYIAIGS